MDTEIIKIEGHNGALTDNDIVALAKAGEILRTGGLVAFPTETVYGLGGDALNPESSKKIYAAKGRPSDNPLIVHIYRFEDIERIVSDIPMEARILAEHFWPGPLTMIMNRSEAVPLETTGGLNTVAVRWPSHPVAQELIKQAGGYVAAPSANTSGRPSPTVAKYVIEDMNGRIDMIIDDEEVGIGLESTIIDLTVTPPQVLRPGYITQEMLSDLLGQVDADVTMMSATTGQAPKAPGMKYRHYAPKGTLTIVRGEAERVVEYINSQTALEKAAGRRTGVIGTSEVLERYRADEVKCIGSRKDEDSIGKHLYTILREFDDAGVDVMFSECFATEGFGQAIMNRLLKAAGHNVIDV